MVQKNVFTANLFLMLFTFLIKCSPLNVRPFVVFTWKMLFQTSENPRQKSISLKFDKTERSLVCLGLIFFSSI